MYLLIPLYSSAIGKGLYLGQCVLVFLALLFASPPLWAYLVCVALCLAELISFCVRKRPNGLIISGSEILLNFADQQVPVRLHSDCYCHPYLIVLHFTQIPETLTDKARHHTILLLPDSCPTRLHRQLRTALRWHPFDEKVLLK